jgi:hypothetical protein
VLKEIFMIAIKKNALILEMMPTLNEKLMNKMLEHIVEKLDVELYEPENEIVK